MIVGVRMDILLSEFEEDMAFLYTNTVKASAKKRLPHLLAPNPPPQIMP
jgi:hypothetical protein